MEDGVECGIITGQGVPNRDIVKAEGWNEKNYKLFAPVWIETWIFIILMSAVFKKLSA